jgi:hypothetical protein
MGIQRSLEFAAACASASSPMVPRSSRAGIAGSPASQRTPENKKTGRMAGLHRRKVAGVAGLEPVTSAVTGQRSNQLSYTPAVRRALYRTHRSGQKHSSDFCALSSISRFDALKKWIRAADAKEVGVGNPAEETSRSPNRFQSRNGVPEVNPPL